MPRRTNLEQAAIFYAKKHFATDDVTVEESKVWRDPESGAPREADIVIETVVLGTPVVISIEVKAEKRKLDLTKVEGLINKHERLPTTTLVIVSWSGFTKPALAKVKAQGGWVQAPTAEPLPNTSVPPLTYLEMQHQPGMQVGVKLRGHDDELITVVPIELDVRLYSAPSHDAYEEPLRDLVQEILNHKREEFLTLAQQNDDTPDITGIGVEWDDLDRFEIYLHNTADDQFHRLSLISIYGPISVSEQRLDFAPMRLVDEVFAAPDEVFAFATVKMSAQDAVWVLTPRDEQSSLISWRML